jgi:hypothetical protein
MDQPTHLSSFHLRWRTRCSGGSSRKPQLYARIHLPFLTCAALSVKMLNVPDVHQEPAKVTVSPPPGNQQVQPQV